jgi:hypothetical protein
MRGEEFILRCANRVRKKRGAVKTGEPTLGSDPYPTNVILIDYTGSAMRQPIRSEVIIKPQVRLSMQGTLEKQYRQEYNV